MSTGDGFWGTPIFRYTRADALRDGVLHDITEVASTCADLPLPAAITDGLWRCLTKERAFDISDENLKHLCYSLLFARVRLIPSTSIPSAVGPTFVFRVRLDGKEIVVKCVAHPGDDGKPVVTLMKEDED